MNYPAVATSLAIGLCLAMGCKKEDPGPDVAFYTNKLAGNKIWNHQHVVRYFNTDSTWYVNDTSFAIEVVDDFRLKIYGYELKYSSYTDGTLTYQNQADESAMFVYYGTLRYNYKVDSIYFSSKMFSKGNYGLDEFRTHL